MSSMDSAISRTASRQAQGDTASTGISPDYEVRNITVARGIQFHNDTAGEYAIPDYLVSKIGSNVVTLADGTITYNNDDQHVTYVITQVTTKSDFKTALETSGIHVVYVGHARFGEGMCFGDNTDPGEDWGNGTDNDTGLWRAGFPFIGLPVTSDILEHQFTVNPVSGADSKPAYSDCHPHVQKVYSSMNVIATTDFDSGLTSYIGSADTSNGFWGYDATSDAGKYERHVLVHSGWTSTDSDPMDLGATNICCKVFCCVACSTFVHTYPVVRKLKQWTKSGDDHYAYWTTNVTASSPMAAFYLYRLLSYSVRNDNQPWANSLAYAVSMANQDYVNYGPPVASRLY